MLTVMADVGLVRRSRGIAGQDGVAHGGHRVRREPVRVGRSDRERAGAANGWVAGGKGQRRAVRAVRRRAGVVGRYQRDAQRGRSLRPREAGHVPSPGALDPPVRCRPSGSRSATALESTAGPAVDLRLDRVTWPSLGDRLDAAEAPARGSHRGLDDLRSRWCRCRTGSRPRPPCRRRRSTPAACRRSGRRRTRSAPRRRTRRPAGRRPRRADGCPATAVQTATALPSSSTSMSGCDAFSPRGGQRLHGAEVAGLVAQPVLDAGVGAVPSGPDVVLVAALVDDHLRLECVLPCVRDISIGLRNTGFGRRRRRPGEAPPRKPAPRRNRHARKMRHELPPAFLALAHPSRVRWPVDHFRSPILGPCPGRQP